VPLPLLYTNNEIGQVIVFPQDQGTQNCDILTLRKLQAKSVA
jgi:hypothetical protein